MVPRRVDLDSLQLRSRRFPDLLTKVTRKGRQLKRLLISLTGIVPRAVQVWAGNVRSLAAVIAPLAALATWVVVLLLLLLVVSMQI